MRTLIIGSGFIGRAVAHRLLHDGHQSVVASRNNAGPGWVGLDVTDRDACASVMRRVAPDAVVLVHGPSDVTWCEANPERAEQLHVRAAENIAAVAEDRRIVLISTDNVFDGTAERSDERCTPRPHNAYGRAKLAAERVFEGAPDTTVLRVSLVYGWESEGSLKWHNFFASCVRQLRRGETVAAPDDHWTTPVLVDDVATVTAAVATGPAPALLHLGGPDRLTRAEWAALIAQRIGASPNLVVPTPRAQGRYASRPVNACLKSHLLAEPVRGVGEGLDHLLGSVTTPQDVRI